MITIKELAQECLEIQNASNLSGLVHGFSRSITKLREIARAENWESTDKINKHPICVMWSSKIASLTNSEDIDTFSSAYEEVCKLSK